MLNGSWLTGARLSALTRLLYEISRSRSVGCIFPLQLQFHRRRARRAHRRRECLSVPPIVCPSPSCRARGLPVAYAGERERGSAIFSNFSVLTFGRSLRQSSLWAAGRIFRALIVCVGKLDCSDVENITIFNVTT